MKLKKLLFGWLFAAEFRELEKTNEDYRRAHARRAELELEVRLLEKFRPKQARFDRYRPMDEEQLAEVLAGAGELPAVKAILQMIDEKFQQANDAASDPELDDRTTKFNLGGADWIVKLKAELQAALEQERAKEVRR